MKIGFYGNNTGRLSLAKLFVKNNIKIDAVFSDDVQYLVETAVTLNAKAIFDFTEFANMCDVIIVSVGDDTMRKAMLKLSKHDLSGKLICAESVSAICDTFDDIGADAVVTGFVPNGRHIYIEGKGKGYGEFRRFLTGNGIDIKEISPKDKASLDLAMFYAESGIATVIGIARELMVDAENFDDIIRANVENALLQNGKSTIVDRFDIGAVRRYNETARGNNLAVYQTLVLKALETADLSQDEKDRIKSIIIGR